MPCERDTDGDGNCYVCVNNSWKCPGYNDPLMTDEVRDARDARAAYIDAMREEDRCMQALRDAQENLRETGARWRQVKNKEMINRG